MKIFMTGANGFLGTAISERLIAEGHEVHGLLVKEDSKPKTEGVIAHKGNLLNFDLIGRLLRKINPDMILHLAARTEVEKSFYDPISFSSINYVGTVNLIEKAKDLPNLKLFLFASTMETYGEVYTKEQVLEKPEMLKAFDEMTPQFPNAPYAVAKLGCEYYLEYAKRAYSFPFCALRQTNTYGRRDNDFFVTEQILTQMIKNPDEINLGYKDPWRNLLYVDDLVECYMAVIKNYEKAIGNIFCIGPDNALTMENLAKKIADKLGWKGVINWDKKPVRVGEIYYLNSKNELIKDKLGWEPKTSLDEGLDKTIAFWKDKLTKK